MNSFLVSSLLIVRDLKTQRVERCQNCYSRMIAKTAREAQEAVINDLKASYKAIGAPCSVKRLGSLVSRVDGKEYEYCLFNAESEGIPCSL